MQPRNNDILTPSQLNTLARDLLEGAFPLVWVEGELGNLSRPGSGHLYFTLKDARAQVRCAMFRPKSSWLKFTPREGLKVLARGRLTLYEARGDYQLVLDHMEEAGEGALRRAYEELRARLQAEGLFDASRKRALPAYPSRIGVITSPSGAAVRDVLSVLQRRYPLLEVDVLPVQVQGETAAAQIVDMLQRAARSGRYDVLLVARGGGSLEDLWAFNDEQLAHNNTFWEWEHPTAGPMRQVRPAPRFSGSSGAISARPRSRFTPLSLLSSARLPSVGAIGG